MAAHNASHFCRSAGGRTGRCVSNECCIPHSILGGKKTMRARIALILALVSAGAGSTQSNHNKKLRLAGQTSARRYSNIVAPLVGDRDSRPFALTYLVNAGTVVKKGQTIAQLAAQSNSDLTEEAADPAKQAKAEIVRRKAEQAVAWDTLQQSLRQAKSDADH